jgi:butyryl-CoA dehydrogenase
VDLDLTTAQQTFLDEVRRFADDEVAPRAAAIDESDAFPRDLVARAGALGLMGVTIPEAWGGRGLDDVAYTLAVEIVARASATLGVILAVNNSLVAEPLLAHGTDEQKARWLKPLARGSAVGAFALSEEHAGTDAANQQTRITHDGFGFRLNGQKVWVANAAAADVLVVFAAAQPDVASRGISCFIVPGDAKGITRRARADSLGVRGLGCMDLDFHDVRVDSDQRLGAPGKGFSLARLALEGGRVAIAAQALGVGQAALDEALAYAKSRQTFGQPIANYQGIQWMLADMATELDAARMLTLRAASMKDAGQRHSVESAMAKLMASDIANRAARDAVQIYGGYGYLEDYPVERHFRDAQITEIYEGTSEIQRLVIAAGVLKEA